jgi:hypothetical protein
MSAYKDALHITVRESAARVALASELLASGTGVVVLDNLLALRPEAGRIICEVIANGIASSKYAAAVEAAQALLKRSTLFKSVAGKALTWLVVDDYGMGVSVVAHGS